jgi:L-lactate dehydrogenase (cytochrome)
MVSLRDVVNIEDLRRLARRRLPQAVFDYIDGGADDEVTMRANREAFRDVTFEQRGATVHAGCDLSTTVLGTRLELPFLLAPVGSSRVFYPRGECAAAREAGNAGTAYVLSTLSGCTLEEVKAETRGPAWFQLYLVGGRNASRDAIERAKAAGYSALVVTIDTAVAGNRERDARNGIPKLPQLLTHLPWLIDVVRDGGLMRFPNVVIPGEGPMRYAQVGPALERAAVTWEDLRWIRDVWNGPLVIKGVMSVADARRAVEEGADAIVVSNHGGRQLDGVPATLRVLPDIAAAVGIRTEVLFDGGIRRGSDVVKALCLGARAVLVGRAYAYGLGAAGGDGVARAIEILRADVARTLKLLGCSGVSALNRSFLT